ncbi:hypothetical protein FALBO_14088 [Fusarium albosuccineum]|uniref:Uncharacterized protein n=1 Tax=Fusarium albosuccineum TaxID=1237068 RepID=A0A8H4KZW8_9HYPO|nr:hypothetical protein FALBO_14088 [Fusarium albosuccineum]KAF4980889.1 hypothetical protein FDECE_17788 [Fusarium decemcellulare]
MATLTQCLECFPILDRLMSYLSATDSSILLGVTGLLYDAHSNAYARYVNIFKDIPEYAVWIQTMTSNGHTLLLVGKDLEKIEYSYKYPLTYWKRHARSEVRSLWLVALATKMFKNALGQADSLAATDENGDVFEIPMFSEPYMRSFHWGGGCSNALCFPSTLSVSYNLPPPLPWPWCAYEMMEKHSWLELPREEDSNIALVYLPNYCREDMLFDESTEASEPYFSAIFGSSAPFYVSIRVPYMNMTNGEVRVGMTDVHKEEGPHTSVELEWTGNEWDASSDMNIFVFAFYRTRNILGNLAYRRHYEFMAIEFAGLDPDLHKA